MTLYGVHVMMKASRMAKIVLVTCREQEGKRVNRVSPEYRMVAEDWNWFEPSERTLCFLAVREDLLCCC